MQFNSYEFVLAFFPAFLLAYFLVPGRWNRQVLILGGAVFYAFAGWGNALRLAASILVTGGLAAGVARTERRTVKNALTALCVILHAGALFLYKYWWVIPRVLPGQAGNLPMIIQPLGFSFFSFQQIMYILALRRGELKEHRWLDYLSYILYFPKLTMGPLAEPGEIIAQIRDPERHRWDWYRAAAGLKVFSFGMFKKMVIADTFARAVNAFFETAPQVSAAELALVMLSYTFQIYFDFSGYIDMAAGISSMLNIDLPLNFNSPYRAVSVSDFWKRWHISLTRFFTRNIYIPLGGNRKGVARTCANILAVFLISGMWHGAHPTFLLWGLLNGLIMIAERVARRRERKIPAALAWPAAFLLINILWLLFRSGTVGQWAGLMRQLLSFRGGGLSSRFTDAFFVPELTALLRLLGLEGIRQTAAWIPAALFLAAALAIALIPRNSHKALLEKRELSPASALLAAGALVLSLLCLGTETVFIYSGF